MDNTIFTNNNIRALVANYFRDRLKDTEFQGFTPHSLSHSYATNLITNDIDFKTVARILCDTEQGYKQVEQLINSI